MTDYYLTDEFKQDLVAFVRITDVLQKENDFINRLLDKPTVTMDDIVAESPQIALSDSFVLRNAMHTIVDHVELTAALISKARSDDVPDLKDNPNG